MIARCERCGSSAVRFIPDPIGRTVETCERRRGGCGRTVTISGRRPGDVLDALEAEHAAFVAATRAEVARDVLASQHRVRPCYGPGRVSSYTLSPGEGCSCVGDGVIASAKAARCAACAAERVRRVNAGRRDLARQRGVAISAAATRRRAVVRRCPGAQLSPATMRCGILLPPSNRPSRQGKHCRDCTRLLTADRMRRLRARKVA